MKWLLPFLWIKDWKIRFSIISSLFFTLLSIALHICLPVVLKEIINGLSLSSNSSNLLWISFLFYGLLWTLNQITEQLRSITMYRALERGIRLLSIKFFDHLHSLSMQFHLNRRTGAISSAFERAKSGFESLFWGLFLFLLPTSIEMFCVVIIFTYFYGVVYGVVLLTCMILYIFFSHFVMNIELKSQDIYNRKCMQSDAKFVDSIFNVEIVKYFGNQKYEYEQYDNFLKQQEDAGTRQYLVSSFASWGQNIIVGLGFTVLVWISGNAVLSGKIAIGDFVLINGYILQFLMPLQHFGYIFRQVKKGLNDIAAIMQIVYIEPEIRDPINAINSISPKLSVKFDNVSFSYDNKRTILKDLSFTIPAGKTIAIVGPTGIGKSTIVRLLFRLYDVTSGRILLNDYDIRDYSQHSLQQLFGVVSQDTSLFNDTLYYNIAYGNPYAPKSEIEKVVKLVHLDNLIRQLPEGLQTLVGERGLKLSGGEKQRVAIARVLLKKPQIYIFDEATSALDLKTENEIQFNIKEISSSVTTIIITHRLSVITDADEIIVLDQNAIVERGTHSNLLHNNGPYAKLWSHQQKKDISNSFIVH